MTKVLTTVMQRTERIQDADSATESMESTEMKKDQGAKSDSIIEF
jgi:hypothetical protein